MATNFTKQLTQFVHRQSDGFIPNLGGLDLRPGTILKKVGARYEVAGTVAKRVLPGGDYDPKVVEDAVARLEPKIGGSLATLKLAYKSEGTTIVKSSTGINVPINVGGATVDVKCNLVVNFESEQDFVFDVADSSSIFTFDDNEMEDVLSAARDVLDVGEAIVVSVVFSPTLLAYIAKTRKSTVGFEAAANADLTGLGIDNLADAKVDASFGLSVNATRGEQLTFEYKNMVSVYRVLVKTKPWFAWEEKLVSQALMESAGDGATGGVAPKPKKTGSKKVKKGGLLVPTFEGMLDAFITD